MIQVGRNIVDWLCTYFKSHIWMRMICSMLFILLVIMCVFQGNLQNQYYDYLVSQTENMELSLLSAATNVLNSSLYSALRIGSEIAVNDDLYEMINDAVQSGLVHGSYKERALSNELNNISHFSDNIAAITIVTSEGLFYEFGRFWNKTDTPKLWTNESLDIMDQMYDGVLSKIDDNKAGYYYVSIENSLRKAQPKMRLFHISYPLLGKGNGLNNVDICLVISFCIEDMVEVSSLCSHDGQTAVAGYLTSEDGTIIYHEDEQYIGMKQQDYLQKHDLATLKHNLDYFGWTANIAIENDELKNEVEELFYQGSIVYIILIALLFVGWQFVLRGILRPIDTVKYAMEEIAQGHQEKIHIGGTHEVWQLADQYNNMIDALRQQRELVEKANQEKIMLAEMRNQAEIKALESQINAHFLCNTLNAINYSAMESGDNEVSNLLKQLSHILQYTFSTQTEDVTLGQEIHWVRQYLYLQKYRLMDKFEYNIVFPEAYNEWPCCKLFLQPFVENAIIHGFDEIDAGGRISIIGTEAEGRFRIVIEDNGCGMSADVERRVRTNMEAKQNLQLLGRGNGIGICNVITRMKMFFGTGFEVRLETKLGEGTRFSFWLPLPVIPEEDR